MDVLVKIVRYLGVWFLNQDYAIVTIDSEAGEVAVIIPAKNIEGDKVWLEMANKDIPSLVSIDSAPSLQKTTVDLAKAVVVKLKESSLADDQPRNELSRNETL